MKSKVLLIVMLVSLIATLSMIPSGSAEFPGNRGPIMDVLRLRVVRTPAANLVEMLGGTADVAPDQVIAADMETQRNDEHTVTQDLGFHMGYIAYNIRDTATVNLQRPDRGMPTVSYWPLHDVEFRHALIHSYDQLGIIPPIYGYVVTPVRSLVPPAQAKYYYRNVPKHGFNQGDPFDPSPDPESSVGILKAKGYTFVDADSSGTVTDVDYWKCPDGSPLPKMIIWTPLATDAPTSFQHGQEFVNDLAAIGLAATTANGDRGMTNLGRDFGEYLDDVYGTATTAGGNFDAYMVFHTLGRIPAQLYSFLHSSQDSRINWGQSNGPGVNNGTIDALTETIRFSLDTDEIEVAAKKVQDMLYTPDKTIYPDADDFALAYMLLYSRSLSNAFTPNLRGIVKSPGYGSDNGWTFLRARWVDPSDPAYDQRALPGGTREQYARPRLEDADGDGDDETVLVYMNGLPPDSLNPTFATTAYEWNIIGGALDGLTAVNPYNHLDIPWVASDWQITDLNPGMEIDFTLRSDVFWQDGYQVTSDDIEFALEFYRDAPTINFAQSAAELVDVVVTDSTHFTVIAAHAGLDLFYDYSGTALACPPQVWDRDWGPDPATAVANYQPDAQTYGADMADGGWTGHAPYAPGPWASQVPTNLLGTGPWIFRLSHPTLQYADLWANRQYFMTQTAVDNLLEEMFWEVGDVDRNYDVNVDDHHIISQAWGHSPGDIDWDVRADLDKNGLIGIYDYSTSAFYVGWKRERRNLDEP